VLARREIAAIGNAVGNSDPITKLCNIEELRQRSSFAKCWPRQALFAEKEASVDETTQIVPQVVERTHSHIAEEIIGENGYPIRGRMQQHFLHVEVRHRLRRSTYNFKGVWDTAGKVVKRPSPFYCLQEREKRKGASEYKTQQRQNTPENKALFEAASHII
jgi:hypothetical protein